MRDRTAHIVIIGGGISGLSAAWELQQSAPSTQVTLLEADNRWGGKILTQIMPGPEGGEFVIDAGPESFVTRKRSVWQLTRELGLEASVIDPGGEARGTYVLDAGRPVALPLSPGAFVGTSLVSLRGKLRMMAEPFIPRKQDDADESLAAFVTRRLGPEALDKFIGPVLGGIYNTNPEEQSILVTSPVMREIERQNGSLVRGLIARARAGRRAQNTQANPPPSRFIGFAGGAEVLVQALVKKLRCGLLLESRVAGITRDGDALQVALRGGRSLPADSIILATPANVSATLLKGAAPAAAKQLATISHSNIGTISLAYRSADLQPVGAIRGLMIPRREGRRIDAVVFTSAKIPARAPDGYGLIRVFFGGGDPSMAMLPEAELLGAVRSELRELLGIETAPLDYRQARWTNSYPQAAVGHLDLVDRIEAALPPQILVTGSSYRGLAVPDCVSQGRDAAKQIITQVVGDDA